MVTDRQRRTLDSAYSGRDNAFNFLRLTFAFAVLVGHSDVLGFGVAGNPFRLPLDLGGFAVTGFFALSGFLITRSGRRTPFIRYWWHRALRIFPGLWVCLLVSVAVVGPLLWVHGHGGIGGYWSAPKGPLDYFLHNFYADPRQDSIGDILAGRPNGALNGSLWTLKYELACYVLVGGLALVGVLRRARVLVALMTAAGMAVIVYDCFRDPQAVGPLASLTSRFTVPLGGTFLTFQFVVLTTAFLLGATAELYRGAVPLNDALGAASLAAVVAAVYWGLPLLGPALIAYVYLLLWLGIRLPAVFRRVGRSNDYSYGVYIYAFVVQQTLGVYGLPRYGHWAYLGGCALTVLLVAAASWHLVEKPALKLKDWTPSWARRGVAADGDTRAAEIAADLPPAAHPAPVIPAPRAATADTAERTGA